VNESHEPPRPNHLAELIGERLAKEPPPGYSGRYSAAVWAQIAQAVLNELTAIKHLP
jgi:hypothetical protein